jgi:predicted MFS family arabinose efflux permease
MPIISVALGVGAFLGGLASLRLRPRYPVRVAFTIFLLATPALIGLLAAAAPLPLLIGMAGLDGASAAFFNANLVHGSADRGRAEELSRARARPQPPPEASLGQPERDHRPMIQSLSIVRRPSPRA